MDKAIEKSLEKSEFSTQGELKSFVSEVQSKIAVFEKSLYEQDKVTPENLKKVKVWRSKLLQIIKGNKELPVVETETEKSGLETLKILNRQINIADTNQKILDKSTLKILSLDYSSGELENMIKETTKKFEQNINKEKQEDRKLIFVFILFVGICLSIIFDKIYLKFS